MAAIEPWPSLDDKEFIDFAQQYPSQLCKRSSRVLRKFAKGFIACKFSALAYLLIGILWLDRSKTKEEKIDSMKKCNVLKIGSFKNKQLENIFMKNKREDPSRLIHNFDDIVFEDDIALLGIVENDGYQVGEIYHYFLMIQTPTGCFIVSSYGSDEVSIYQYKTKVTPEAFTNFVESLKKDKSKTQAHITKIDIPRIRGFMRAHFLNPRFKFHQSKTAEYVKEHYKEDTPKDFYFKNTPKDIHDEIERYTKPISHVVQFQSILNAIQDEIANTDAADAADTADAADAAEEEVTEKGAEEVNAEEGEDLQSSVNREVEEEAAAELKRIEEAEKAEKGGTRKMRTKKTRKGNRKHYVYRSRCRHPRTFHKK